MDELRRVLAACEGNQPARIRDRAIVLLLARLGLRAGDVAQLRLSEIDWQAGTIHVTGKGRYQVRLPLPQEVGEAVLRYVAARPVRPTRIGCSSSQPVSGGCVRRVRRPTHWERISRRGWIPRTPFSDPIRPKFVSAAVGPAARTWRCRPTAGGLSSRESTPARSRCMYATSLANDASPMLGTEGGDNPFFSPDGAWIGFWANGSLRKIALSGGPVVEICKTTEHVFGASWGPNDLIVFAADGLLKVSAAGGEPVVVTTVNREAGETRHRLPSLVPNGEAVIFSVARGPLGTDSRVVVQRLQTGERRVLVEQATDGRYASSGHLVFIRRHPHDRVASRRPARLGGDWAVHPAADVAAAQ